LIYVVIGCHFKSRDEMCWTSRARLIHTMARAEKDDQIIVTGGSVPYKPEGPTLGDLMLRWLVSERHLLGNHPKENVSILYHGVGTFSEARLACEQLKGKRITVVSSPWYLFQGMSIWRRRARENNVNISFVSVPRTGGLRTIVLYTGIGIIVRAATFLGLEGVLERRLTASQQSRLQGFTFDGCK